MLSRIKELNEAKANFAFETTLASRVFTHYLKKAKADGFETTLLFFWLNSEELAIARVRVRVKEGGHDIPKEVIRRRYRRGLLNFFQLYRDEVDNWMFIDNSEGMYLEIAQSLNGELQISNREVWSRIKSKYEK